MNSQFLLKILVAVAYFIGYFLNMIRLLIISLTISIFRAIYCQLNGILNIFPWFIQGEIQYLLNRESYLFGSGPVEITIFKGIPGAFFILYEKFANGFL